VASSGQGAAGNPEREVGMEQAAATRTTVEIYKRPARAFHWLTVVLVAIQVPVGFYMAYRGNVLNLWDGLTGALYNGHKLVGVTILLLVLWRLAYRLTRGAPADEPTIEPWQRLASHANHWALYALLICTPLAGYVGISLFPALDIFGLFSLPGVVAPNKDAAGTAFTVHAILALLLVLMIAMHIGAALFHYFVRKDNVLGRMIPTLLRR
jgi:cytochrome b561